MPEKTGGFLPPTPNSANKPIHVGGLAGLLGWLGSH